MGAPIYTEWLDEWGSMMEDFDETSDNCEYLMRAMETEEIRQAQWLESKLFDRKSWCIFIGVLGLGFVDTEGEVSGKGDYRKYFNCYQ